MGSCEADYCFIEKRPTETEGVFRITKGCIKRPSRKVMGCDYDHYSDHVKCVCSGNNTYRSIIANFVKTFDSII